MNRQLLSGFLLVILVCTLGPYLRRHGRTVLNLSVAGARLDAVGLNDRGCTCLTSLPECFMAGVRFPGKDLSRVLCCSLKVWVCATPLTATAIMTKLKQDLASYGSDLSP